MKTKAIYGGTFDPIHNGHLFLGEEAFRLLKLDELIFVPVGNPPHKRDKIITEATIRYDLVKKAIEKYNHFSISSFEIENKRLSYTYDTLCYFNSLYKDTKWFFLVGSDCLFDLDTWNNVPGILELCTLVVFNRPGFNKDEILKKKAEVEKKYNKEILYLDMEPLNISSSMIREKIILNEDITGLLPENIEKDIKELGLYQKGNYHVE